MDSTATETGIKRPISNTGIVYPQPALETGNSNTKKERPRLEVLSKGFDLCAVAGTFIAAVQSAIIGITLSASSNQEPIAIRAINTLFLGGLVLDVLAAALSFLTSRWLQRLSEREKDLFETHLADVNRGEKRKRPSFFIAWLSLSLFVPMPVLVVGVASLLLGIYVYVWTQQPIIVAAIVTLAGGAVLPFLLGIFLIGRDEERRENILKQLGTMVGDW